MTDEKWFICGAGGKRDRNGLPERVHVCPAHGVEWSEIYERKERNHWRPIETAPKDGTVIDLWLKWSDGKGERIPDGYWSEEGFDFGPGRCDGLPGWGAENMGYDGCPGYADDPADGDHITHWMPLPAPPQNEV